MFFSRQHGNDITKNLLIILNGSFPLLSKYN